MSLIGFFTLWERNTKIANRTNKTHPPWASGGLEATRIMSLME